MKKLYPRIWMIAFLVIIGLTACSSEGKSVIIEKQLSNLNTGEEIISNQTLFVGDVVEKRVFIKNTSAKKINNFIYQDIDHFSNKKKEYSVTIEPKATYVIREKTIIQKKHHNLIIPVDNSANQEAVVMISNKSEKNPSLLPKTENNESLSSNNNASNNQVIISVADREQKIDFWEINSVLPTNINNDFDLSFQINGNKLSAINEIVFQCASKSVFLPIASQNDNLIMVNLPAFVLENGNCTVGVVKNGIAFFTEKTVIITKNQTDKNAVRLKSIVPNIGSTKTSSLFIVTGRNLDQVVAVQIDNGVIIDLDFVKIISPTTMVVNIPANLATGEYYFRLLTKEAIISYPQITFKLL